MKCILQPPNLSEYKEVGAGLIKMDKMASGQSAVAMLSSPRYQYLKEQVRQRIQLFQQKNPDEVKSLDFDQILYTVGNPKKADKDSYYVRIVIYSKIIKQHSAEVKELKDLLKL